MVQMPNLRSIFTLTISIFLFLFSCKYDTACTDTYYEPIYLITEPINPFPYHPGDRLVFKDSTGNELIFTMFPPQFIGNWSEGSTPVESGPCKGYADIYYSLNFRGAFFKADSLDYIIYCEHQVRFEQDNGKPRFFDTVWALMQTQSNSPSIWSIYVGHIVNDRGNEDFVSTLPTTHDFQETFMLNAKEFNSVYSKTHIDGSEIYYNDAFGVIGFQEKAKKLWVLDRIE